MFRAHFEKYSRCRIALPVLHENFSFAKNRVWLPPEMASTILTSLIMHSSCAVAKQMTSHQNRCSGWTVHARHSWNIHDAAALVHCCSCTIMSKRTTRSPLPPSSLPIQFIPFMHRLLLTNASIFFHDSSNIESNESTNDWCTTFTSSIDEYIMISICYVPSSYTWANDEKHGMFDVPTSLANQQPRCYIEHRILHKISFRSKLKLCQLLRSSSRHFFLFCSRVLWLCDSSFACSQP